ncbi:MAG TPA: HD domain-containing protein [Streptosporangiaceae bacterium]|jgi:putative hydrolase of HD superfamily
MDPLDSQLRFLLEADKLKTVFRQSTLIDASRKENSAEHSWHLALMALVLRDHSPPGTDLSRVIAMLLLHDLVEIDAGDLFLYAGAQAQARQEVAERAAADRIFALLPPPQAEAFRALWDEFEERRTQEAKFARALDRLQPMLANYQTGGGTWLAHGVTADQVLLRVALIEDGSATLGEYARDLIDRSVARGFLAPGP